MKDIWTYIQIGIAAIGGVIGRIIGGVDGLIYTLIFMMIIDYLTGVANAIVVKKLSSEAGFKGICRKVLIIALVGIGNMIDMYVIGQGAMLRTAIIFFYISNEGISILENAARLGLPVPDKLRAILEQLHDKE